MSRRVIRKWRPPLILVLGGTLAVVFALPILGITYFRLAGGILGWAETAWMIFAIAFVATLILGLLLWRLVLRPVQALTAFADSEGAVSVPAHFGTPEFSQLGKALMAMTTVLQGRENVIRSYADHVTHELKAPLTVVHGAAELLCDPALAVADRAVMLGNIQSATARMDQLLDGLQRFARAQEPMPDGQCLVSDVLAGFDAVNLQSDGPLPLSEEVMGIVMSHLHANALAHGATCLTVAWFPDHLLISDDGPGISQGNRARAFDPFFTTRRDTGGTGLGLSIVRRMLAAHDAEIELLGDAGAMFEIRFAAG